MADAILRTPTEHVYLMISLTVEEDYRNRGVFPGLRIDKSDGRFGTRLRFRVPTAFAQEVLEDAQVLRQESTGGLRHAYGSLAKNLQWTLDDAEGVQDDPGKETWQQDVAKIGCHGLGTRLQSVDGHRVMVVRGYGLTIVSVADGDFRNKDGRFDYRYGYACVDEQSGERHFYSAGELCELDGSTTHLRLVRGGA